MQGFKDEKRDFKFLNQLDYEGVEFYVTKWD